MYVLFELTLHYIEFKDRNLVLGISRGTFKKIHIFSNIIEARGAKKHYYIYSGKFPFYIATIMETLDPFN